jgi:hypothetical protein
MIADVYEVTEPDGLFIELRFRPNPLELSLEGCREELAEYVADYKYLYSLQAATYVEILKLHHEKMGWMPYQELSAANLDSVEVSGVPMTEAIPGLVRWELK